MVRSINGSMSDTAMPSVSRRGGFTLVEMLVSVTVIVALAALLLPATNRSREMAKSVKCEAALRHIYLQTAIYADDHNGGIPTRGFFVAERTAAPLCPSARDGKHMSLAYGGYDWGLPFLGNSRWARFDLLKPVDSLVQDTIPWHDPARVFLPQPEAWHGRHNVLWGDGRISRDLMN